MKVVVDTNALLLPFESGIDIFRGIEKLVDGKPEFVAFEESFRELKSKSRKNALRGEAARAALEKEGAQIIKEAGKVDDMIADYAAKNRPVAVCTEDRKLMARLRKIGGVQLIYSKERSHLATDWQRND